MGWLTNTLTSTLGRKVIVSLTGLFLILFLTVHLIGNLQLLKPDGGEAFNLYADFMGNNALVQVISKMNFLFILLHIIVSVLVTRRNKMARFSKYKVGVEGRTSSWSSRNMAVLGILILAFLILHLKSFYAQMKWGSVPMVNYGEESVADLYTVALDLYSHWYYVAIYVVSLIVIAFHLSHGFQSAFQTLGLNHVKYSPAIKFIGVAYSIVIPLGFALIPLYMFFN